MLIKKIPVASNLISDGVSSIFPSFLKSSRGIGFYFRKPRSTAIFKTLLRFVRYLMAALLAQFFTVTR